MASVFFPDDEERWYDSDDSQNDLDGSLPSFASMSELTGTTWAENYQNFDMEEPSYDKKKLLHTTEEDIYIARQRYGYCSVGISLFQIIYLVFVICLCGGLAPLKINPNIGPYPDGLNHSGAKNAFQIVYEREYWRLITPAFLHSGLVHLFCKSYSYLSLIFPQKYFLTKDFQQYQFVTCSRQYFCTARNWQFL